MAQPLWVAEADIHYQDDGQWQTVVIFELGGHGLIVRETRYCTRPFPAPAWRAELVESMNCSGGSTT